MPLALNLALGPRQALLLSIQSVSTVILFSMLFIVCFAIIGMGLYSGKLYYCVGDATPRISMARPAPPLPRQPPATPPRAHPI